MVESSKIKVSIIKMDDYNDSTVTAQKVAEAIDAAGGLPEKFCPSTKVLIKPNMLTAKTPEFAATTHPEIVRAIIKYLRNFGITDITVGDSPAGTFSWDELWDKTGFAKLAEEEKVKLIPFENVKRLNVNNMTIPMLRELDDFDAVISVPKLKTHMLTKITGAVKNSYGLMPGNAKSNFHGDYPSPRKMATFIAQIFGIRKPDFIVMDAVFSMEGEGPSSGEPVNTGLLFAGIDAAAVDACACAAYGYTPLDIPLLVIVGKLGYGVIDMDKIEMTGDGVQKLMALNAKKSISDMLHRFPEPIFKLSTYFLSCRPYIMPEKCRNCGLCAEACSQKAICKAKNNKRFTVKNRGRCILCMCCVESCPFHAIKLINPGMKLKRIFDFIKGLFHKTT
ncbi:MAG: hypothetical protein A2020_02990 [Lentisphaerae bacterium GWF2_45_14]|nr:MAG: hypothetical protein A2020_02990 [Lentisphaerae bacterium GWF2_45_14]